MPFLLPWIATMGYCHCRQVSWGVASHRSDLRRSRAQIHANHTPFFSELSSSFPSWHIGQELLYEDLEDLPLPKWRICSAWRRWTCLHMYPQPPPHGHPWAILPWWTLLPLYKSAIHCPWPPHPNPQEQLVPLLITSPKPWPGLAHPTYYKRWLGYKRKWTWPWGSYWPWKLPWTLTKGS